MPYTRIVADVTINQTDTAPYLLGIYNLRVEFIEALKNLYCSHNTQVILLCEDIKFSIKGDT